MMFLAPTLGRSAFFWYSRCTGNRRGKLCASWTSIAETSKIFPYIYIYIFCIDIYVFTFVYNMIIFTIDDSMHLLSITPASCLISRNSFHWALSSWHSSGVGSVKTVWSVVKGNAKALAMLQDHLKKSDISCLRIVMISNFMWFALVNVWVFLIIYALADAGKDQADGLKATQEK